MIQVVLPYHLRNLARIETEIRLRLGNPVTAGAIVDALEARYPALSGTIREHGTGKRRPFVRFFVCREDWSFEPWDRPLPESVADGREPFLIVGAMAGG